jgi:hypothetical protein
MPKKSYRKKYGFPTEMLAVRVPAPLHRAVKKRAKRERKPKSEMVVGILSAAFPPEEAAEKESVFE